MLKRKESKKNRRDLGWSSFRNKKKRKSVLGWRRRDLDKRRNKGSIKKRKD